MMATPSLSAATTSSAPEIKAPAGKRSARISPRADPATLEPSGGPINRDALGAEHYATVYSFAESPIEAGLLWAGSDDGLLHVSRDDGAKLATPRIAGYAQMDDDCLPRTVSSRRCHLLPRGDRL